MCDNNGKKNASMAVPGFRNNLIHQVIFFFLMRSKVKLWLVFQTQVFVKPAGYCTSHMQVYMQLNFNMAKELHSKKTGLTI